MPCNNNDDAPNEPVSPTVVNTRHTLVHGLWIPSQLWSPVDVLIADSMEGRAQQISALLGTSMWGFKYVANRTHLLYYEPGAAFRAFNGVAKHFAAESVYGRALLVGVQDGIVTSISPQVRKQAWQTYLELLQPLTRKTTEEWWSMAL